MAMASSQTDQTDRGLSILVQTRGEVRKHLHILFFFCFAFVLTVGLDRALAQRSPGEAESMSSRLIRDARSYYDNLEMDPMEDALEQIIEMSRRFGNISPRFAQNLSQAYILKGLLAFVNSDNHFCLIDILSSIKSDDPILITIILEFLRYIFQ